VSKEIAQILKTHWKRAAVLNTYPLLTEYSKALARKNIILDWNWCWNFYLEQLEHKGFEECLLSVPSASNARNSATKRHLCEHVLPPSGDSIQVLQLQSRTSSFGTFCLISLSSSTACLTKAANTSLWKTTEIYLCLLWFYS